MGCVVGILGMRWDAKACHMDRAQALWWATHPIDLFLLGGLLVALSVCRL